jgi:transcriptional regulator with XRE-family HTH domain
MPKKNPQMPPAGPAEQVQEVELVGSETLWKVLGYRSPGAFRQAAHRGHVPIPLMTFPHRRGRYALRREVTSWLRQVASTSDAIAVRWPAPVSAESAAEGGSAQFGSRAAPALGAQAFGAAIRSVRQRTGAMQKEVALSAGIDQSVLAGMESGRRPPPKSRQLQRLLQALAPTAEERNQVQLAWELSRLTRSIGSHDDAFKETLLRVAVWLASMSPEERAVWQGLAARLQPTLPRKEDAMS